MFKGNKKGQMGILIFLGVIAVLALIIGAAVFDTTDASHKGVKVKMGKIIGTMDPGMEATGLFVDVHQYDLRLRKMDVNMEGTQGAVDKDGQAIFANVQVNYKINPSAVEKLYSQVGKDGPNLAGTLNLDGIVREGFKSVTSQYTSLEIFQKRSEIKEKAIAKIKENFPGDYFYLENVIVSNIAFDPVFQATIQARKNAEEDAKKKEQEVIVAENQAKIDAAKAEGAKQVRIKAAEAAAEEKRLEAEAEAFRVLEEARAEAEGLKMKKQELTPLMVENNKIDMMRETWSGNYPQMITGDSASMLFGMNDLMAQGSE